MERRTIKKGEKINELKVFQNKEFGEVRISLVNNEPYFCLADICRVLELTQANKVKERLKEDGWNTIPVIDSMGRTQQATFINEANLYKVIFQSRKPEAENFSDWVTSEVLPSIEINAL